MEEHFSFSLFGGYLKACKNSAFSRIAMEYGLRLSRAENLPSDPREFCRAPWRAALPQGSLGAVYFGTEFCEDLLPASGEAEFFCELARDAGVDAVLMTPVVTSYGLGRIDRLLRKLIDRGWSPAVTFNDWGVLGLLRQAYPRTERRAGRLINRGLRDPRLAPEAPLPGMQGRSKGDRQRSLLQCFGVTGIETDPDLEGCYLEKEPSSFQRTLHLPFTFAASGRNCLLKTEETGVAEGFTKALGRVCGAPCRGRLLPVKRRDTELLLWRSGNTLFYEATEKMTRVHLERCDRIVLHERPMP